MKRWIIAGLDDSDWDLDAGASKQISLGRPFLADFAVGLSEEQCDRIANSRAATAALMRPLASTSASSDQ